MQFPGELSYESTTKRGENRPSRRNYRDRLQLDRSETARTESASGKRSSQPSRETTSASSSTIICTRVYPTKNTLQQKIVEGDDIRQLKVIHTWEEEDGSNKEYYGEVIKFKKKKTSKISIYEYEIGYWVGDGDVPELTIDDCTDVRADMLVVDILTGDCKIME